MNMIKFTMTAILVLTVVLAAGDSFKAPVLKKVDKVELLSIYSRMGNVERVDATKTLEGQEAEKIAAVWRRQKIQDYSPSSCHQPPYALKFYEKDKVVLFVTVCWACRNVTFVVPQTKHWIRFDAESKEAQELREVFEKTFPGEKKFGD
jgi:hypothetical protein